MTNELNYVLELAKKWNGKWRVVDRGMIRSDDNCCPLSAAANYLLGEARFASDIHNPAKILGIPYSVAMDIASVADANIWSKADQTARTQMLTALVK